MQTIQPEQIALLLDMLNQAFPGEMRAIQTAKAGLDNAHFAQVQAQRQGHREQTLSLLHAVYSARITLQMSVMRLGFSIFYYALFRE